MLYGGASSHGNQADMYKTAVIDTIVAEVQSLPGEDRCVLLLGYKDQITEMFQVMVFISGQEHVDQPISLIGRTSTLACLDVSLLKTRSTSRTSPIRNCWKF